MRKDILERMEIMKKEGIKPNYAGLAKQLGCDYRTVKRYYECKPGEARESPPRPSVLDPYKQIVQDKLQIPCTAMAIYKFIRKRGYEGSYSVVRKYCGKFKDEARRKATIRFETAPGLQAQVDWKESKLMKSRRGEAFEVNIFLVILGYSRMKYIELTTDRKQRTVFGCLVNAFKYFGGVPQEILFDNMKTVVDHSRSEYDRPVVNSDMYEFSKDMGFRIVLCRAFRPQTKGKVENLAKVTQRLDVYNNEFDTFEELDETVRELNADLNAEVSQATNESPLERFEKEKEYLNRLPRREILEGFDTKPVTRKVSKESMVLYNKSKYSVSPRYVGRDVELDVRDGILYIYYNKELINSHKISGERLNYKREDVAEILRSDALKGRDDSYIEDFIENSLSTYDRLGGGGK